MAKTELDKAVEKTAAAKLWDKIKDIQIDIFGLPGQTIKDHAKREDGMDSVFPDDIYVTLRSAAAYPALEEALANATMRNQVRLAKVCIPDFDRGSQEYAMTTKEKQKHSILKLIKDSLTA